MGDLTKNLSRSEFACKCAKAGNFEEDGYCGGKHDTVDFELVNALQDVVDHFKEKTNQSCSILITSGNRCLQYNEDIGGSPKSYHKKARAGDFQVYIKMAGIHHKICPHEVADYLESKYPDTFGIGRYDDFTHLDTRSTKARWGG